MAHQLTWADVWLLQSIHLAPSRSLEDIVAVADGINHSILTHAEFNNGMYNLVQAGLLSGDDQGISLTDVARDLLRKTSGKSYLKQAEFICSKLQIPDWSGDYDPNRLTAPQLFVSMDRFNNAVQSYTRKHGL